MSRDFGIKHDIALKGFQAGPDVFADVDNSRQDQNDSSDPEEERYGWWPLG